MLSANVHQFASTNIVSTGLGARNPEKIQGLVGKWTNI